MKRILITENKSANVALFEAAFEALDFDYRVSFVSSGEECMEYLKTSDNYDLCFVLLDLNTPGVIEKNLLTQLSENEAFRSIPVIVFSENTEDEKIIACYNQGANAFVRRPTDGANFNQAIETITDFWTNVNVLAKPETLIEF